MWRETLKNEIGIRRKARNTSLKFHAERTYIEPHLLTCQTVFIKFETERVI